MGNALWTTDFLEKVRREGDPEGDRLAALVLTPTSKQSVIETLTRLEERQKELSSLTGVHAGLADGESVIAAQTALARDLRDTLYLFGDPTAHRMVSTGVQAMGLAAAELELGDTGAAANAQRIVLARLAEARSRVEQFGDRPSEDPDLQRRGYNHLLSIADKLIEFPELSLVGSSMIHTELDLYPRAMVEFFSPVPCPDWVDPDKIAIANRLWEAYIIEMLVILYSASLPYCYLIKNGIPMLYSSGKLLKDEFIYQRLYETGLMLDGVLDAGGLAVVEDIWDSDRELFVQAIRELCPEINFRFEATREAKWDGSQEDLPPWENVVSTIERLREEAGLHVTSAKRYLGGRGFLYARKVRLLHASMRFMALHPHAIAPPKGDSARFATGLRSLAKPYDVESLGYPINQEDMAYTLLTFGYVIPAGLEKWGVLLKRTEKEAFLHTWKVIGHLMGLRKDLLTDDLDEAKLLFETILERQCGRSEMGVRLTDSVCHVLEEYLPSFLGSRHSLPPLLIIDQLGHSTADEVLSDEAVHSSKKLRGRVTWFSLKLGLWLYMRLKTFVYRNPGEITSSIEPIIHRAGEALFESWRGPFTRRAFFLPETFAGGWQVQAGAGDALKDRVRRWRKRIFYVIGGGLLAAIVASVSLIVSAAAAPFLGWNVLWAGTALALASGALALYLYQIQLPRTIKGRPKFPYEQSLPDPKPKSGGT